uniref:Uncharacterized protein n=1 Tax=Ditylenchus dipsaci TaxID=166011 RepID=A0A915DS46_9BILA
MLFGPPSFFDIFVRLPEGYHHLTVNHSINYVYQRAARTLRLLNISGRSTNVVTRKNSELLDHFSKAMYLILCGEENLMVLIFFSFVVENYDIV